MTFPGADHKRRTLLVLLAAGLSVATVFGQQSESSQAATEAEPVAVVTIIDSPADETSYAQSVTAEIVTALTFLKYHVTRADFLPANSLPDRAEIYYRQTGAKIALFGVLNTPANGSSSLQLSLWSKSNGLTTRSVQVGAAPAAGDSFRASAERSAISLLAALTGESLSAGTLVLENTTAFPQFTVYVDGQKLDGNRSQLELVAGSHEIIVGVPGALGDQPVLTRTVLVPSDGTVALGLPTAAAKVAATSGQAGATGTGSAGRIAVDSIPPGASVYLDNVLLGITPLSLLGVPAGKYNLRLSRTSFVPQTEAIAIDPNQTTRADVSLSVDTTAPDVAALLRSPGTAALTGAAWDLASVAFFLLDEISSSNGNQGFASVGAQLAAVVPFARIGFAATGAHGLAAYYNLASVSLGILSAGTGITAAALKQSSAVSDATAQTLITIATVGQVLGLGLSTLGEILFAGGAADRANIRTVEEIQKSGDVPHPAEPRDHRIIVETGGGSIARVGYQVPIFRNLLVVDATAGLAARSFTPFLPLLSLQLRPTLNPFASSTFPIAGVIFGSAGIDTNINEWGLSLGFGLGVDATLKPLTLFARAEYRFGFAYRQSTSLFTIGARL